MLDPILWIDATGTSGWSSVPIFNGSLPGNQAALGTAMGGGVPASTGGFAGAIGGKIMEGANGQIAGGGTIAAGVGYSASTGVAFDTSGRTCSVVQQCVLIGPILKITSDSPAQGSIGKLTPGDTSYSIAGEGGFAVMIGGEVNIGIASDGAISGEVGESLGISLGAALKICKQQVTNKCNK